MDDATAIRTRWVENVRKGVADGTLLHTWGGAEKYCLLSAADPGKVDNAAAPCLESIGPLWMRDFLYQAFDGMDQSRCDAWALALAGQMATHLHRPFVDVRHRFASEVVLPEALQHFDHEQWPDVKAVIDDKTALHRRALAGAEPAPEEWREVEKRAAGAARAAWAAWAAAEAARDAALAAEAARAAGAARAAWAAWAAWAADAADAVGAASWTRMADAFLTILIEEDNRNG